MQINKPLHQWQLSFEGEWATSVAFLDNNRIAAGNRAGDIYIWDLTKPATEQSETDKKAKTPPNTPPLRRLVGHTNGITHLVSSSDGKMLISSSLDHTIRFWNPAAPKTGETEVVLDQTAREAQARYKSKTEKAAILEAPGVKVETVAAEETLTQHTEWIQAMGLSADGSRLITGDDACLSIVWDVKTRKPVSQWHGYHRVWVRSAALSPDGQTAFTAEFSGGSSSFDRPAAQARFWNTNDGSLKLDLLKVWTPKVKDEDRIDSYGYGRTWGEIMKRGLVCAAFAPDGKWLAVGQGGETDTGKIHLIDTTTGKITRTVSGHRYGACDVKFSADSKYVVSGGRDTMVRVCQVSDGKEACALGKSRGGQFKDWMHALAISPDQTRIAAADIAGLVHVWQVKT